MIFEEGSVLYFRPFIFPDGGTPKQKYFLVPRVLEENILLASLPTSQDHIPAFVERRHGCIELPDINFNCYFFSAEKVVAFHPESGNELVCYSLNDCNFS